MVTFYHPKNYPEYIDKKTFVLPYIGTKGATTTLHLKLNYCDRDWVFWNKVIFAVDDDRYEMTFNSFDVNTTVSTNGKVVEFLDYSSLTESDIALLRKIPDSEKTIVRFQGDTYRSDYEFTEEDKQAFADVLAAYDVLK